MCRKMTCVMTSFNVHIGIMLGGILLSVCFITFENEAMVKETGSSWNSAITVQTYCWVQNEGSCGHVFGPCDFSLT